jgi:hypothetical protein
MGKHGEELLAAAAKYSVTDLEPTCEEYLCSTINSGNVAGLLYISDLYRAKRLKWHSLQ